jgi:predicted  nucleic acid-binding Zn-ribbon protein
VQVEAKLKQQTATAAADTAALQGALEEAFTAAEDLHQQLAAAEDREAALSKEVLAVRGQVRHSQGAVGGLVVTCRGRAGVSTCVAVSCWYVVVARAL